MILFKNIRSNSSIRTNHILLLCVALFFVYFLNYFLKIDFKDSAFFGGDTWEYHSMGVNFALGHGLKIGEIEGFELYKFSGTDKDKVKHEKRKKHFSDLGKIGGRYNFYRTQGYPFFLGTMYKLFGISPKFVKIFQLILLTIVSSFLPFVGFLYWKNIGFIAGVLSSYIFIKNSAFTANKLMAEPLLTFLIFLLILSLYYWEKNKNTWLAIIISILLACSVIIKGHVIFLPFLLFLYYFIKYRNNIQSISFQILSMILCFVVLIALNSIWVTSKANRFILLSTQGSYAILQGNNEFTLQDGKWHKDFDKLPNSFYSQKHINDKNTITKLILFYKKYLRQVPKLFINKLEAGFSGLFFLKLTIYFYIIETLLLFKNAEKIDLLFGKNVYLIILLTFFSGIFWINKIPFLILNKNMATFIIISLLLWIIRFIIFKKKDASFIPFTFFIFFINYLLLTITFFGLNRFIQPLNFLFILSGISFLLHYINKIFYQFFTIRNNSVDSSTFN